MLKHMFTGLDNETYDIGRMALAIGILVFCVNSIHVSWVTCLFDPQAFGIGFGSLCAGIGGLLKLKEGTEPK